MKNFKSLKVGDTIYVINKSSQKPFIRKIEIVNIEKAKGLIIFNQSKIYEGDKAELIVPKAIRKQSESINNDRWFTTCLDSAKNFYKRKALAQIAYRDAEIRSIRKTYYEYLNDTKLTEIG
jgi:hypothetical protein